MEYIDMDNFLRSIGETRESMDAMWCYCAEHGHWLISNLTRCGKCWYDLNTSALQTLRSEYTKMVDRP